MKVSIIGIDLAKDVFQVAALNQAGKEIMHKKVRRNTSKHLCVSTRLMLQMHWPFAKRHNVPRFISSPSRRQAAKVALLRRRIYVR